MHAEDKDVGSKKFNSEADLARKYFKTLLK